MKILHWYHDLMNLYGDYGNVKALAKHLEDQGVSVTVERKTLGEKVSLGAYDFVYIGSGTEKRQALCLEEILTYRDEIEGYLKEGKLFLATGNAMELFGEKIDDREALSFVRMQTRHTKDRYVSDVIAENGLFRKTVGFINRSTVLDYPEDDALFRYLFIEKGMDHNAYEGFRKDSLFGTHLIGPLLVKNPRIMEYFALELTERAGKEYHKQSYPYEEDSYRVTLKALSERAGL